MCDQMTNSYLSNVIHLLQDLWYGRALFIMARPRWFSSTRVSKLVIISTKFWSWSFWKRNGNRVPSALDFKSHCQKNPSTFLTLKGMGQDTHTQTNRGRRTRHELKILIIINVLGHRLDGNAMYLKMGRDRAVK